MTTELLATGSLINVQTFKTSGTFTPTSGMSHCIIQCLGGGGAGGGAASGVTAGGGGGGAGGFSQSYVTAATIGASQTVTIGAGGTGSANANGGNGSDTSVGSIVIAKGGSGGVRGLTTQRPIAGAAGGVAGTGDLVFTGGSGGNGMPTADGSVSGNGGDSYFSSGAAAVVTVNTNAAGINAAANTGAGGSGSCSDNSGSGTTAGGNGGSGIVIIYEYDASGATVVLPTTTDHIATYADTAGTLSEDPTTAITSGALSAGTTITAGTGLEATTGDVFALTGNVNAGSAGHDGALISWPPSASNGLLALAAVDAGAPNNTIISNSVMGQGSTIFIPDPGASSANFVLSSSPIRMKSVAGASAAGGSASQSFTDSECTSASNVIGNWKTQTNAATVLTIVPSNGSFVVTSTADAGVGTFNYIITK